MNNTDYSFNKRYLVIGIIIFIISVYITLNTPIPRIDSTTFYIYTACFTGCITVIVLILRFILRNDRQLLTSIISAFIIILVFITGVSRTFYICKRIDADRQIILKSTDFKGIATASAVISSSGKSYAVETDIYEIKSDGNFQYTSKPIKVLLYLPSKLNSVPQYGDTFECSFDFEITSVPPFKGAFDYSRYLKQKGICSTIYCSGYTKTDTVYNLSYIDKLHLFGMRLRSLISDSCNTSIYSSDEKALLKGLLLGDKEGFSDSLYESYTDSGLVHIISVSGMHTSYLFLVISFILSFLKISKRLYPFFVIPVLILFGSISLFTPSVSRSVIMLSILLSAPLFLRKNDSITALAISAAIIIFVNPFSLESYSLILSYSATLGILIFAKPLSKLLTPQKLRKNNFPLSYTISSLSLSIGGTIGTSYFTARFFGRIPIAGLIANIFIFPLVATSFIGGYVNCLLYYIYPPLYQLIAFFILKPVLYLTNLISHIFSQDIFLLNTPTPDNGFFIVWLGTLYVAYILIISKLNDTKKTLK